MQSIYVTESSARRKCAILEERTTLTHLIATDSFSFCAPMHVTNILSTKRHLACYPKALKVSLQLPFKLAFTGGSVFPLEAPYRLHPLHFLRGGGGGGGGGSSVDGVGVWGLGAGGNVPGTGGSGAPQLQFRTMQTLNPKTHKPCEKKNAQTSKEKNKNRLHPVTL